MDFFSPWCAGLSLPLSFDLVFAGTTVATDFVDLPYSQQVGTINLQGLAFIILEDIDCVAAVGTLLLALRQPLLDELEGHGQIAPRSYISTTTSSCVLAISVSVIDMKNFPSFMFRTMNEAVIAVVLLAPAAFVVLGCLAHSFRLCLFL